MKNLTISKNSLVTKINDKQKKNVLVTNVQLPELSKEDIDLLIKKCDELHTDMTEKYNLRKYKQLNDAITILSLVKSSLSKIN